MSRLKRYAHSLASGYVQMGANVVYTLASVPLAFAFLSKEEFGIWALVTLWSGYLALLDLGMATTVGRSLFDFKDNRCSGEYGSVIQTGVLISLVQGLLILGLGLALAPALAHASKIPAELRGDFIRLMGWQCAITAVGFPARMFGQLLTAQHRWEIPNYSQAIGFTASLLV